MDRDADNARANRCSYLPSLAISFLRTFSLQFTFVFFIAFAAKGQSIINPVPSVDGWSSVSSWAQSPLGLIATQHRYGQYLLFLFLEPLGFRGYPVAYASVLLALVISCLAAIAAMQMIFPSGHRGWVLVLSSALFAIHPNFAEIFTFSNVTLDVSISLAMAVLGLSLSSYSGIIVKTVAVSLVFLAISIYQISVNIIAILVLLHIVGTLIRGRDLISSLSVTSVAIAGIVSYSAVYFLSTAIFGVEVESRGQFSNFQELLLKGSLLSRSVILAFLPYWAPSLPSIASLTATAIAATILVVRISSKRGLHYGILAILVILAMVPATIGLVLLSARPWIVPRVLIGAGLVIAGITYIGMSSAPQFLRRLTGFVGFIGCLGFVSINNIVFYEHQKIVSWDAALMNRVVTRFEQMTMFDSIETVAFYGSPANRPRVLTSIGNLQQSGTTATWSQAPLFEQATGRHLRRTATADEYKKVQDYCKKTGAVWPSRDSVVIFDVVGGVCFAS